MKISLGINNNRSAKTTLPQSVILNGLVRPLVAQQSHAHLFLNFLYVFTQATQTTSSGRTVSPCSSMEATGMTTTANTTEDTSANVEVG